MAPSLALGETILNDNDILKGANLKVNETAKSITAGKIVDEHIDAMDEQLRSINRKVIGFAGLSQIPIN